ncbi:O-antigen ligase family protein, partial [Candidatus Falkowbacteria bacterium]|nr:O-antigen ligase family protein [Candidatus Falkowbacteria bacterium]
IFTSANYVTMLTVPTTILILGYLIKLVRQKQITMKQCNNETMASRLHGFMAPFLVLTTSISIATIYLTRSYSGYLGIAFGILILVLISSAKKKLKTIIIITLIIFSAIFLYTQKDNPKLRALTDLSGHTAIHSRIQIWKTSFAIIKDNPILGIGLGNFHSAYIKYLPKTIENPLEYNVIKPHNLYLNLWLETGLLGLIAFLWLIVIFYKKTTSIENCKLKIENSAVIAAAMTAILVQGLLDTPYFKNDLSLIFWLLIGLTIINKKAREHTNEHTKTQEKCQSG